MVVAQLKKASMLYVLLAKLSSYIVNAMENDCIVELWHKKVAHMIEKELALLEKKIVLNRQKVHT